MDVLFNKIILFVIAIMVVTAFLVYSVTTIRRVGVGAYFKVIGHVGKVIVSTLGAFVASLVALLAASADTSEEEESDISAGTFRGGTLNYRTGKLDDGTDPYGWYEKN
ncbi:MAG: hypothetical protein GY731_06295 [Gammaproteobacteria bacterium]|nr:hypothetical protein [Gammaproteobacteria bacterium]